MAKRAVVMYKVSNSSPPKQQLVGRGTGMLIRLLRFPILSQRSKHPPLNWQTHTSPAISKAIPSGRPKLAGVSANNVTVPIEPSAE